MATGAARPDTASWSSLAANRSLKDRTSKRAARLSAIYQEMIVPEISVAANVFLHNTPRRLKRGAIDRLPHNAAGNRSPNPRIRSLS
jgi:ABC-type sugar transport system ATPase subunit